MFYDVQPALLFQLARPATGSLLLTRTDGPRAGPAADARIVFVVQGIVRNLVLEDEAPDLALGPTQQRIDFHQAELRVPLHNGGLRAVLRLVLTDGADPGIVADDRLAQREDFAIVATLIGTHLVNRSAVFGFVL